MIRSSASARRVLGLALALSVGTGVGLAAPSLWSGSEARTPLPAGAGNTAAASTGPEGTPAASTDPAGTPAASTSSAPLTLDEAKAIAARAASAPGRVIEWDEDQEPTGLRYDLTLLHDDGSTTEVEVDTVTGRVTSTDHDDDRD